MLEIVTVCVTHGVRTWVSRCESSTRGGTEEARVYRSVLERDPTAPTQISPRPPSIPMPRFPISYFLVEAHKSLMVMCSIIMFLNDVLDYPDASTNRTESLLHGSETAEINTTSSPTKLPYITENPHEISGSTLTPEILHQRYAHLPPSSPSAQPTIL